MQRRLKTFLHISAVLFLIIFLHYQGALRFLEGVTTRIITAVSISIFSFSEKTIFQDGCETVTECQKKIRELEENARDLLFDRAAYLTLQQETGELRDLVQYIGVSTSPSISAAVIGKSLDPITNTMIINAGAKQGVRLGNPVIVGKGILIGKIVRAEEMFSIVRLLYDNQSKIAATVLNNDRSIGVVEGGYGISVRMNFVPQHEIVAVDDIVVSSGLEPGIPRGLVIGRVESIEKEVYEPFQRAVLSPAVNVQKVSLVSVLFFPSTLSDL